MRIELPRRYETMDWVAFILAVVVFCISSYCLVDCLMNTFDLVDVIAFAVMILASILVVFVPVRNPPLLAGIFALSVAIFDITLSVEYYLFETTLYDFLMGTMYVGVGLAILMGTISYMRGASKSVLPVIYASAISALLEIVYMLYLLHCGESVLFVFKELFDTTLVSIVSSGAVIALLSTTGIKTQTLQWKIDNGLACAKILLSTDPKAFVYRDDMEKVIDWFSDPSDEGYSDGIVVSEISVNVVRPKKFVCRLNFQRYADGRIMAVVTDKNGGSFAKGFAVSVDTVVPDRETGYTSVRFYGKHGMFFNVLVGDREEKKSVLGYRK